MTQIDDIVSILPFEHSYRPFLPKGSYYLFFLLKQYKMINLFSSLIKQTEKKEIIRNNYSQSPKFFKHKRV